MFLKQRSHKNIYKEDTVQFRSTRFTELLSKFDERNESGMISWDNYSGSMCD